MQGYLTLALTAVVLTMNVLGLCFTLYRNRPIRPHPMPTLRALLRIIANLCQIKGPAVHLRRAKQRQID